MEEILKELVKINDTLIRLNQSDVEHKIAFEELNGKIEEVREMKSKRSSRSNSPGISVDGEKTLLTPNVSRGGGFVFNESDQIIASTIFNESKSRKQSSHSELVNDAAAEKLLKEAKERFEMEKESTRVAKRQSIVSSMSAQKDEDTGVQNFRTLQLPTYDHIKLEAINLKSCIKFFKSARLFQVTHSFYLRIQPITSEKVRAQLDRMLIKNGSVVNGREVRGVIDLKLEEVFTLVHQILIPDNAVEFYSVLHDAVFLRGVDRDRVEVLIDETFEDFYTNLITYRDEFLIGVELLVHGGIDSYKIPPINNKENGLVRCFLSKIPRQFGALILALTNRQDFLTVDKFMSEFFEQVNKLYEQSVTVVKINKALQSRVQKKQDSENTSSKKSSANGGRTWPRASYPTQKSHVSAVSSERGPVYKGYFSSGDSDNNSVEAYTAVHYNNFSGSSASSSDNDSSSRSRRHSVHQVTLQKKQVGKGGSEGPRGCIRFIFGRCEAGTRCMFSHEEGVLCETAVFQAESFMKTKYYQMAKAKGIVKTTVAAVRMVEDVKELGGSEAEVLKSTFLHSLPDACLKSAVYKSGDIKLPCGKSLEVPKVLIDSGAIQANYLSKNFVDKHRDLLKDCIKQRPMRAYLADHKTKVEISCTLCTMARSTRSKKLSLFLT